MFLLGFANRNRITRAVLDVAQASRPVGAEWANISWIFPIRITRRIIRGIGAGKQVVTSPRPRPGVRSGRIVGRYTGNRVARLFIRWAFVGRDARPDYLGIARVDAAVGQIGGTQAGGRRRPRSPARIAR